MTEKIFGPVLTAYVYLDDQIDQTLELMKLDSSTTNALTGAVFAEDRGRAK
jgi:1-pyrroline-5-carboxylate dehydrogenase